VAPRVAVYEESQIRHYIKTCVPLFVPLQFLRDYLIHYGLGRGIGYPWVVRLVVYDYCESVEGLNRSQTRIMEITRNLPCPWEVESLYYPSGSTVPTFSVRTTKTESSKGHKEYRSIYGPTPNQR